MVSGKKAAEAGVIFTRAGILQLQHTHTGTQGHMDPEHGIKRGKCPLELETKVHSKVRNHREGL